MRITPSADGQPPFVLYDFQPSTDSLCFDVVRGLARTPKELPPKYFYDETGARLFERITRLPEYYPTRTEMEILRSHTEEIATRIGPGAQIIEFGSGSGEKTRILLRQLDRPAAYLPIDISREQLIEFSTDIARSMPGLKVFPICADYTAEVRLPRVEEGAARKIGFFPGSTIGNFEPLEAERFLRRVRALVGSEGALLLGVDLRKSSELLEAAYNDAAGVTAAFNLNLLQRINRECGADFDLNAFRHHAHYQAEEGRIEMQLVSTREQVIILPNPTERGTPRMIRFGAEEPLITEHSYKYDSTTLEQLARAGGWSITELWMDEREWFALALLEPV